MTMLSVFTRHSPPCPQIDIHHRRCHCPKWIRGRIENAGLIRQSARTNSWTEAEKQAREMEKSIAINTAAEAYLNDERSRRLRPATLAQKRAFIKSKLLPWCEQRGLVQRRYPTIYLHSQFTAIDVSLN